MCIRDRRFPPDSVVVIQVVTIEDELSAIGENQKQLEVSEEKASRREEKYQVDILNISNKFLFKTELSS